MKFCIIELPSEYELQALDPSGVPTGITGPETASGYTVEEAAIMIANATERREADYMMAPFGIRIGVFLR